MRDLLDICPVDHSKLGLIPMIAKWGHSNRTIAIFPYGISVGIFDQGIGRCHGEAPENGAALSFKE